MSKDFTPAQIYDADKKLSKKGSSLRSIIIKDSNGNTVIDSDPKIKNKYPELYFLFPNLPKIYEEFNHIPAGKSVLTEIETEIKHLETKFDNGSHQYVKPDPDNNSINNVTALWFFGQLDPNYYYNIHNNRLFTDFIVNRINERIEKMNNTFTKALYVSKETAEWLNKKLSTEPENESDCFGEDEKYSVTAKFDNGFEMDIEMCGVQYHEGETNTPWTQAVLYDELGSECTFTEPSDEFLGEWTLEYDNNTFIVNVTTET